MLATPTVDAKRYSSVWDFDLRLAKNTVLQAFRQVNSSSFERIDEILGPRIVRFGARFSI